MLVLRATSLVLIASSRMAGNRQRGTANQLAGVGHVTKVNARAQSGAGRRTLTKSFYYPIRGWAKIIFIFEIGDLFLFYWTKAIRN